MCQACVYTSRVRPRRRARMRREELPPRANAAKLFLTVRPRRVFAGFILLLLRVQVNTCSCIHTYWVYLGDVLTAMSPEIIKFCFLFICVYTTCGGTRTTNIHILVTFVCNLGKNFKKMIENLQINKNKKCYYLNN